MLREHFYRSKKKKPCSFLRAPPRLLLRPASSVLSSLFSSLLSVHKCLKIGSVLILHRKKETKTLSLFDFFSASRPFFFFSSLFSLSPSLSLTLSLSHPRSPAFPSLSLFILSLEACPELSHSNRKERKKRKKSENESRISFFSLFLSLFSSSHSTTKTHDWNCVGGKGAKRKGKTGAPALCT